jgi:hypothetical protein
MIKDHARWPKANKLQQGLVAIDQRLVTTIRQLILGSCYKESKNEIYGCWPIIEG